MSDWAEILRASSQIIDIQSHKTWADSDMVWLGFWQGQPKGRESWAVAHGSKIIWGIRLCRALMGISYLTQNFDTKGMMNFKRNLIFLAKNTHALLKKTKRLRNMRRLKNWGIWVFLGYRGIIFFEFRNDLKMKKQETKQGIEKS